MTTTLKEKIEIGAKYGDEIEAAASADFFDVSNIPTDDIAKLKAYGYIVDNGDKYELSEAMKEFAESVLFDDLEMTA